MVVCRMPLISCPDCGKKDVSDRVSACPNCGCPLAGGGSVSNGNIAFENRIEEYKNAGYLLRKRNGDTVEMLIFVKSKNCPNSFKLANNLIQIFFCIFILVGIFLIFFFSVLLGVIYCAIITGGSAVTGNALTAKRTATITLTKIGKLEETGFVLKT